MFEDYSERLLTHFVAGQWRAPFGDRCMPVDMPAGKGFGQIVAAGPRDVARAVSCIRAADTAARNRFGHAVQNAWPSLLEGFNQSEDFDIAPLQRSESLAPHVLLGSADTSLKVLIPALQAGVGGGVIFCPAPEQAVLAVVIATLVQNADVPPGAFAMLPARTPITEAALRKAGLPILDV
jgi:acyl-CoA reductase-like NAD-dependent aldehyde dehydrogenase